MLQCVSHSPAMQHRPLADARGAAVAQALEDGRRALAAFAPELAVIFAPDHYNGFFYELMPPFCVGARARGVGDYGTRNGPLPVDGRHAAALHAHLVGHEFDAAVSHDMWVDHAVVQPLDLLLPPGVAVVPVFINCIAQPIPSLRRARHLGAAVGGYLRGTGLRVAILGSGGLSHDPPLPGSLGEAPEAQRGQLTARRELSAPERAAREQRTLRLADDFAAGRAAITPICEAWDRAFLVSAEARDWAAIEAMADDDITARAGRSAHEVRAWLAALGALEAFGGYRIDASFYAAVPEWIVGFGALRAESA